MLLELVVSSGLQPLEDLCVGSLCLPVVARVHDEGKAQLYIHIVTVILKEVARDLGPVIGDLVGSPLGSEVVDFPAPRGVPLLGSKLWSPGSSPPLSTTNTVLTTCEIAEM